MNYSESIKLSEAGYEVAQELELLDIFLKNSKDLINYISEYNELLFYISDPWIDNKIKEEIFHLMKFNKFFVNWMLVIIESKGFAKIEYILEKFRKKYNLENNFTEGYIYSTIKIKENIIKEFEEKLTKKFKRKIVLTSIRDMSILGGAKIVIDDYVFDNSVEQRTKNLVKTIRNK